MANRYSHTHFQQLWNKKHTQIIISALFIAAIVTISYLSFVVTDLTAQNEAQSEKIEELRPYVELSEEQQAYILELEEKVEYLKGTVSNLDHVLSSLEAEIAQLEENLNILNDIDKQTNR